jgi:tripeptidyl-peptidase II
LESVYGGRIEGRGGERRALDKLAAPEDKPASREVLEYRAELLKELGWDHWYRNELSRIKDLFPPAYPLF